MGITINKITKYCLYLLVFLFPFFFLPLTISPVNINKEVFFTLALFLIFILWGIKVIGSGRMSIRTDKISRLAFLVLAVAGLSFVFSVSKSQSLFGHLVAPDTFFALILYVLSFFLFTNLLNCYSRKDDLSGNKNNNDILIVIYFFLSGSGILALLFFVQLFWKIFPLDLTMIVGSSQSLSIFLGGALVVLLALILDRIGNKKSSVCISEKLLMIWEFILAVLFFGAVLIINFWLTWLGLIFGMIIVVLGKLYNINSFNKQNILKVFWMPLLVILISLFFIFVKIPISNRLNIYPNVSLNHRLTLDIVTKSLSSSPKNFILGTGPATFGYQYDLYRTTGPNITNYWNVHFKQGSTSFLTILSTTGVLGALAILLFIVMFFSQGFKFLTISKDYGGDIDRENIFRLRVASFAGAFYVFFLGFFYSLNLSLYFFAFLMLALWLATTSHRKEIYLYRTPQKTFFVMFLGVFLLAAAVIGAYKVVQKYVAAVDYARGLKYYNQKSKLSDAIDNVNRAASIDRNDDYFRTLSQLYLVRINNILDDPKISQKNKETQIKNDVMAAITSALVATKIDPNNSLNWIQTGNVYKDIILLSSEAEELAVKNYQKAISLDPQNPQIPLDIGKVYIIKASIDKGNIVAPRTKGKGNNVKRLYNSYSQDLNLSIQNFKKAIDLKPNFELAYYFIAQAYELQEKPRLALKNYKKALLLKPGDKQIRAKIRSLEKSLNEK